VSFIFDLTGGPVLQPAPPRLTTREREVLAWLAAGKTNRDIAEIIGASRRTVEKHLERIYEKLGVETRTAAVMRAYRA
jgi:DNA-binding CsgD family transcriptional regulator